MKFPFGWIFLEVKITYQLTLNYVALPLTLQIRWERTTSTDVTFFCDGPL
jgi:hypothetical protein